MIQNIQLAGNISDIMLNIGRVLDSSIVTVEAEASREEFLVYRRAVGRIMGEILTEVLNPLYAMHPTIKPEGLD